MELAWVKINAYRRFGGPVQVRLIERLIALVGQNEAGKTSFLDALTELNTHDEIPKRNQTRRLDETTTIEATFRLDDEDKEALNHIQEGRDIEKCTFSKSQDGDLTVRLTPKPSHDFGPREQIQSEINTFLKSSLAKEKVGDGVINPLENLVNFLDTERDYLGDEIQMIKSPISDLSKVAGKLPEEDAGPVEDLIESLNELVNHESETPPHQARETLRLRRPKFLQFEDEDRNLSTTYDLLDNASNPPKALANLADFAELDLEELYTAARTENIALRDDLIEAANQILSDEFSEIWVRSDVVPVLSIDGTVLHINVRTPGQQNRSPIDQRSDGLRWFIALVAFINQRDIQTDPILLIDEAESHLSYDAQAELVSVLENQGIAQKVIYTTHSAGCLPSDLGRGIRPVIQKEGERSKVENTFWVNEPGFKPLMLAMGLGPLAFTVSRNALIAEGPSETILLPTLLREATGQSDLEYQVAPGASNVGDEGLRELQSETGRSVIILDGDEAGVNRKQAILEAGVDEEKVKTYLDIGGSEIVFEDLIRSEQYVSAVNEELNEWQNPSTQLSIDDLPDTNRSGAVEEWCNDQGLDAVTKTNVCQRVMKQAFEGEEVINEAFEDVLIELHEWATDHFMIYESD